MAKSKFDLINPLVSGAHYSERRDQSFSLQIQRLQVDSKLSCVFLSFAPWGTNGLIFYTRWVKFEEDVEEGGNRWSKPHVATLSLHSLFELR